jgi:5-methylcytosine-specific restriction endonuclease McrBC GTP-binding regulatory subunit McrB
MDTDNSIINSYKYENSELINLKDGVINKIGKEFIKNYFYQHKDILNFEENLLPITRGQFFYLQELLTREEKEIKSDYQLTDPENIIFYGPPGTGKTYGFRKKAMNIIYGKNNIEDIYEEYKELVKTDRINFTTFHPDYSYEAFIEGIKPRTTTEDNVIYEIESGAFLKTCENALVKGLYSDELKDEFNKLKLSNKNIFDFFLEQNSDTQKNMYKKAGNFVFIIDEINRGNLPRIFGELITLMEADKRLGAEEQITLKLPYSQKTFSIPKNVHILGSMNTADKSIASIDTALRRRFKFIEVMPNITLLEDVEIEGIEVNELLRRINENIEKYHDREHTIGHAYFMKLIKNPSFDLLCDIMEFQVIPLLQEYFHEDWGKVKLVLNNSELIKELIDKDTKNNKENNDIWKEKEKKIYKVNDSLKNRNESELIKLFKDICK